VNNPYHNSGVSVYQHVFHKNHSIEPNFRSAKPQQQYSAKKRVSGCIYFAKTKLQINVQMFISCPA
jgi:hypothetical protein